MKTRIFLLILSILLILYMMGPRPRKGEYTDGLKKIPYDGLALEQWIQAKEAKAVTKPDNQARIVWMNDSLKNKTKYAVVYLHGFTASQEEGNPVHTSFARFIGANMYLSRLSEHGLKTDKPLMNITATSLWESAKEAYAIGKKLGDSVILVGTSTGGSLALMLAAEQYPEIAGLVLMSPNIAINETFAFLLNDQWGLRIARMVKGSENVVSKDTTSIYRRYWYSPYRLEGAVELEQMLEEKMTASTFKEVKQPTLLMYYYKDEENQDKVVKVSAMLDMFKQLSSKTKKQVAIPNAGDHVIGSAIKSKDWRTVQKEAEDFAEFMRWNKQ
jgi:esterase/lipase